MTATQHIANEIITGTIDIGKSCDKYDVGHDVLTFMSVGIAIGAETLSQGNQRLDRPFDEEIRANSQDACDVEIPMGNTSENVSRDFGITREMQVS